MKKALSLILALVLCLSLCACGTDVESHPTTPPTTKNDQQDLVERAKKDIVGEWGFYYSNMPTYAFYKFDGNGNCWWIGVDIDEETNKHKRSVYEAGTYEITPTNVILTFPNGSINTFEFKYSYESGEFYLINSGTHSFTKDNWLNIYEKNR